MRARRWGLTGRRLAAFVVLGAVLLAGCRPAIAGPCVDCGASGPRIGWWDDRPLAPGEIADHAPSVDVDQSLAGTRAAVAFERRSGGDGDVWLATSDDGGCSWNARAITSGPEDDRAPDVAVSLAADSIAIAFDRDGAVHAVVSQDGGATFLPPVRLHPTSVVSSGSRPRLAAISVAGVLHVHVTWEDSGRLFAARNLAGGAVGAWQAVELGGRIASRDAWLEPDVAADTRSRDAAVDSAVTIVAAARATGAPEFEIVVLRSNDSGARFFGDPVSLASENVPGVVSDPTGVPGAGVAQPVLDVSDDGSGEFYTWALVGYTDSSGLLPRALVDARAEEGAGPTTVADWNNPPVASDVLIDAPGETSAVSAIPNPLQRPPAPEVHAFSVSGGGARAWRGHLDVNVRPTVVTTCDSYPLTGLAPPAPGSSVVPRSMAADEDRSHVFVAWADTRDGSSSVYWKRIDTVAAPPSGVTVDPASCAAGGGAVVTWSLPPAPPHCDVSHVRVEYGRTPGATSGSVDTRGTSVQLTGLVEGATYFVRAILVDEACNEAAAAEVSGVAAACSPVACPNRVGPTLRAAKRPTPGDVELTWAPPPVDAAHDAAISYDAYRSVTRPQDGFTLFRNVPDPALVDVGAALLTAPDLHFYLLVARNACGTSGDEPAP